jgi:PleD family two-component response regulator
VQHGLLVGEEIEEHFRSDDNKANKKESNTQFENDAIVDRLTQIFNASTF